MSVQQALKFQFEIALIFMGIIPRKVTERWIVLINNDTNNRFISVTQYNSHKANERLTR